MVITAIVLILTVNIYLFRKNINVGIIMLLNSIFIAILTKMPNNLIFKSVFDGAFSDKTMDLLFSVLEFFFHLIIFIIIYAIVGIFMVREKMTSHAEHIISNFFFGVTVTFVSLTFPILISFGVDQNIWYAVAAFVSGFIGGMITPVHLGVFWNKGRQAAYENYSVGSFCFVRCSNTNDYSIIKMIV